MAILSYNEWRDGAEARRAALEPFVRSAGEVVRTRPRARTEASFLRSIGTPERQIGPIAER